MKYKLIFTIIMMVLISAPAALADYAMQIFLTDGQTQTFMIAAHPELTVADGVITVKTTDTEFSCKTGDIDYYTFPSDVDPTGISPVNTDSDIRHEGNRIIFTGLQDNAIVAVFTVDGKNLSTITADKDGRADINLESLPKGIYIVTSGNHSTKIIKK